MPSAIVTTVGGTTSNSYVTRTECTTYLGDRLNSSTWTNATGPNQDIALLMACKRLEAESYAGYKKDPDQALSWPRYETYDRDGNVFEDTSIPTIVRDAQCELALALLAGGATDLLADSGLEAFRSVTVGPLAVEPRAPTERRSGALPEAVRRILAPVLRSSGNTIALVRG